MYLKLACHAHCSLESFIIITMILGLKHHAIRYHGILPVFHVHYQDLGYQARNIEKQAAGFILSVHIYMYTS